jgi:hypothetical protein
MRKRIFNHHIRLSAFSSIFFIFLILTVQSAESATSFYKQGKIEKQDQAGSVHIAVTRAVPWEEVRNELEVKFDIDGKKALAEVIPTTLVEQEKLIDAFKAALQLGLPTETFLKTKDVTTKTGDEDTITTSEHEEEASGDISDLEGSPPFSPETPLIPALMDAKSLGRDPLIVRRNAMTLIQAVRLMNRTVKDFPKHNGYEAYVVTLQVNLQPYARNLPLDVYSTISFFSEGGSISTPINIPKALKTPSQKEDILRENSFPNPYVLPILATDNLEAAGQNRSSNIIRMLSMALTATVKGVQGKLAFDKLKQELQSIQGEDLNSLMTIGRLSDNSIRVRFGAMHQATAKYAMVPRNHSISVLVFAPKVLMATKTPVMRFLAKTEMRHAETGQLMKSRTLFESQGAARDLLKGTYGIKLEYDENELLEPLYVCVQQNDKSNFNDELWNLLKELNNDDELKANKKWKGIQPYSGAIWVDLISLWIGGMYQQGPFELRRSVFANNFPSRPQKGTDTILFKDNTKTITAMLRSGEYLNQKLINARISLSIEKKTEEANDGRKSQSQPKKILFSAESITVNNDFRDIVMTFPSLIGNNLIDKTSEVTFSGLTVTHGLESLSLQNDSWERKLREYLASDIVSDCLQTALEKCESKKETEKCIQSELTICKKIPIEWNYKQCLYVKPKVVPTPPPPPVSFKISTKRITADRTGNGSVQIAFLKDDKKIKQQIFFMEVNGADAKPSSSGADGVLVIADGRLVIHKSGIVTLSLSNLSERADLSFTLFSKDKDRIQKMGTPIVIPVEMLPVRNKRKS